MNEPKLRFKADDGSQFPDWERKCLSDIASFHSGLTYTPDDVVDSENGILVFRSSNIQNGRISYNDNVYVDKELKERNYVKLHDIVVCVRNGSKALVGKNALVTESDLNATWGAFMTVIRAKQNYEFVHQYLNSTFFKKEMYKDSGTATINQITTAMLNDCKLFVPSLPEQQKIADFLSTIDTVIEKQKETVSAWKECKKGVMQKLFSQEVRFKADDGSQFPDWEEKKLGECGRFYTGVGFSEKYQGHKGLDVDVYKVSDMNIVGNEKYMTLSNNTVDDSIVRQMKTKVITSKCLVFAKVGAAIYGERKRITTKPFLIDNNMMAFEPYSCLNIEYLHSWSCSVKFSQYAQVGALPSYNSSDIGIIKIHIPCLAEQQKIADCLSSLDEVIEKQKATLAAWEELKKGLLQQMFV